MGSADRCLRDRHRYEVMLRNSGIETIRTGTGNYSEGGFSSGQRKKAENGFAGSRYSSCIVEEKRVVGLSLRSRIRLHSLRLLANMSHLRPWDK